MKANELRKLIREEVRAAVKEELQDILNEAVKYASKPEQPMTKNTSGLTGYKEVKQKDLAKTWSVGKLNTGTIPLEEMLEQTRATMTNEEYKNVYTGTTDMVQKPNFASTVASSMGMTGEQPGLDISKLDFVQKAKSVLDKSYEKDRNKV
jgi:hypothetical protein|tara:strand:+ start:481 stop:930 length:450 start_codon:yes stop_codon:yes gene_type:complete